MKNRDWSVVTCYAKKDGFHNVTMGASFTYGFECLDSVQWVVECDEFTYLSEIIDTNGDSVWARAVKMYKKEIKRVF